MFRVRWSAWKGLGQTEQKHILANATALFGAMEQNKPEPTGLFSLLGHKGDLMLVHFRKKLDDLNHAELSLTQCELNEYLEPTTSYLSVVELGIYEASVKLYAELTAKGWQPGTADWNSAVEAELVKQREGAAPRLWPEIPQRRYLCFYPMNKFRGEAKNWYSEPIRERQRMMREHGMIGRHYAGRVTQIISGSIGFDDWEWGVDLFADDPLVFQKTRLRNALRRSQRGLWPVRHILRRPALSGKPTGRLVRRQDAELHLISNRAIGQFRDPLWCGRRNHET